jgi:hypothetical protein
MRFPFRSSATVLGLGALLAASAAAGDVKVVFSEVATDPSGTVPGALDASGLPVATNWLAIEDLNVRHDGGQWIIKGRTTQATTNDSILVLGSGLTGTMFAQDGQPLGGGVPGEQYDFFDSGTPVKWDDNGNIGFSCRAKGGVANTLERVIRYDGVNFTIVHRQGDSFPGLFDIPANPTGDEQFGNSIGSVTLQNDGTFLFGNTPVQNCSSFRYPATFRGTTAFKQSGVSPIVSLLGANEIWDNLLFDQGDGTPDGAHWLWEGDTENATTTIDGIFVVDDVCIFQEGQPLLGGSMIYADTFASRMLNDGTWFARGDDSADDDWAVRNGVLLAKTGDPIVTGSGENWGNSFSAFAGNRVGDWVLVGNTTEPDTTKDSVLVWNGTVVVAREGDPIDLNNDGSFNDDVFISSFQANDIYLTDDGDLYFLAVLRNSVGTSLGDAFLVTQVCGTTLSYGQGCAGSGGFTPILAMNDCIEGGGNIDFSLTQGLGGSTAVLFLGATSASIPVPGLCTLLVSPLPAIVTLPLGGAGPGDGSVAFSATMPLSASGVTFYLQAFVVEPGFPGFSATNALEVSVQ